jgi:hypothetical protein
MKTTADGPHQAQSTARTPPRGLLALVAALLIMMMSSDVSADSVSVPIALQAELVAKLAEHDRHLAERAGDRVRIAIVAKKDDPDSTSAAARMQSELGGRGAIGGLPHEEQVVLFQSAAAVAALVRAQRLSILYFMPGLGAEIEAVSNALDGVDVLSVAAVADYVPKGIVVGFDLVSGKAKILVNLPRARKQSVLLDPGVLKICTVIR